MASKRKPAAEDTATPVDSDWIAAARTMLIEGGVSAVQVNALAGRLGVTRGGFYWRFRNRQDLLDHLVGDWMNSNVRQFLLAIERAGTPRERYRRLVRMFIDERDFDPKLEAAIRQWASIDAAMETRLRQVDSERIAALTRLFRDAGQEEEEAMVRARIVYFHQIGYYALKIEETRQRRDELAAVYDRILTGF